ncbi:MULTISPECIES: hypothetical protein [Actinoplanes]|uniref:hypothetical protein n=1 Tax=Actinoplanes TaxID=1865 RepID=UPI000ADD7C17|nr:MULTISPECIES: hypothetical protein [Actinoplanes]GLY05510.1 hypothetical protein Acsp01_58890 [Actinoplanes sp. NBRC 101535]
MRLTQEGIDQLVNLVLIMYREPPKTLILPELRFSTNPLFGHWPALQGFTHPEQAP